MTPDTYTKRMNQHKESFEKLWVKIVNDTNQFIKDNPEKTMYNLNEVDRFVDDLAFSGTWIHDRINKKYPKDRGSLTKKIRRVLGYNVY